MALASKQVSIAKQPVRKSASTLRRILDAAKCEFGEKGLDASTIKGIAVRAGVSEQLIYHYYGSKEALFVDASDAVSAEQHASFLSMDFTAMEPVEALRVFFNMMFELTVRNDSLFTAEELKQPASKQRPSRRTIQYGARLVAVLQGILDRGRDAGVFRDGIDAKYVFMAGFLLVPGFMTARNMASRYLQVAFDAPDGVESWRLFFLDMITRSVRP